MDDDDDDDDGDDGDGDDCDVYLPEPLPAGDSCCQAEIDV